MPSILLYILTKAFEIISFLNTFWDLCFMNRMAMILEFMAFILNNLHRWIYLKYSLYRAGNYEVGPIDEDDLFISDLCVNCHFFIITEPAEQKWVSLMFISWNMIIENAPAMLQAWLFKEICLFSHLI